MFCANCGQQVPDKNKFCPSCQAPVITIQPQAANYQQTQQPFNYQQAANYQQPQGMNYQQPTGYQTFTPQQAQAQYANPSFIQVGDPSALKKYLFPRGFSQWAFLACLVLLICMLLSDYKDKGGMSFIFGIGVILCCIPTLMGISRMNKNLKMLNESGAMAFCAADYANARKTLRNRIAFGDQWLFGLGTGNMVRYEDITQIYRHKATVNWIFKVYDVLEVKLANGKSVTICRVPLFHKKDELQEVFRVVNSKNPYAKLGI